MTRSVYVLGGAGAGKSTFTAQVLAELGGQMGPLADVRSQQTARGTTVTLRGHYLATEAGEGLYLGVMRDSFPGSDGLDRVSGPIGEEWLAEAELPDFIISEGATLSSRNFLAALETHTDLLLVLLHAPDEVKVERFARRGSEQKESFWRASATRAANRHAEALEAGVRCLSFDSSCPASWDLGLDIVGMHLRFR